MRLLVGHEASFGGGRPHSAAGFLTRVPALTITPIDGEARILDTVLAEHLGYERPADVRDLIKRNMEELEAFGGIPHRTENPGPKGGRPGTAYYLNRQQALLICILSKTEKAKQVRAEVIRRFDAYEELTRAAPVPALNPPVPVP